MSIFLGALAGAAEGVASTTNTWLKSELDKESKQFDSDLAVQREKTLLAYRNQAELQQIPLRAKATAGAELENAPTSAQAKSIYARQAAQDELDNAPLKGRAKAASEYDPALVAARNKDEEQKLRTKARVEREETVATGNDPQYLAAVRKLTQAKHIEGLGSVAQAELARYSLDEKKKVAGLIERFETTTDATEKARIKESLTVRGIIKPDESSTERVTETEFNDAGDPVRKVERTQKRGAGGSPGAPAAPAGKNGWDSTSGQVFKNGQVIGKAANEKEARGLFQGGAAPAAAAPAAASVPGRPMYDKSTSDLQRMSRKPAGVSTAEANAARAELDARKGEGRLGSF